MRYQPEQLQHLQGRWSLPLLDPVSGLALIVDTTATFAELLRLRLTTIGLFPERSAPDLSGEEKTEALRIHLRDEWVEKYDTPLAELIAELQIYGLAEVSTIESPRYEIRDPYDLRGAYLKGVYLAGAY